MVYNFDRHLHCQILTCLEFDLAFENQVYLNQYCHCTLQIENNMQARITNMI